MTHKLLALLGLLALGVMVMPAIPAARPAPLTSEIEALFPMQLGEWQRVRRASNTPVKEELAYYESGSDQITADIGAFLGAVRAHAGIGCRLARGEQLLSERLTTLPTRDGPAQFNVALMRDDEGLKLMADTQCTASACTSKLIGQQEFTFQQLDPSTWETPPVQPQTPVTIPLRGRSGEDGELPRQQLLEAFGRFAAGFVIGAARRLADDKT